MNRFVMTTLKSERQAFKSSIPSYLIGSVSHSQSIRATVKYLLCHVCTLHSPGGIRYEFVRFEKSMAINMAGCC